MRKIRRLQVLVLVILIPAALTLFTIMILSGILKFQENPIPHKDLLPSAERINSPDAGAASSEHKASSPNAGAASSMDRTGFPEGGLRGITLEYFYNNPCGSCNEEDKITDQLYGLLGGDAKKSGVKLSLRNTFHMQESDLLQELYSRFDVPPEQQTTPVVFIGDTFLSGEEEIEKRLKDEFLKLAHSIQAAGLASSLPVKGTRQEDGLLQISGERQPGDTTTLVYFYVTPCEDCQKVQKHLETLPDSFMVEYNGRSFDSDIVILKYNVAEPDSLELVRAYYSRCKVPDRDQKVPVIFLGNSYLAGEKKIANQLVDEIKQGHGIETVVPATKGKTLSGASEGPDGPAMAGTAKAGEGLTGYDITGVLATGLINGFSPCSISMLLFFLSILLAKNTDILKPGLAFAAGKLIAYFLLGTSLFNLLIQLDTGWFQPLQAVMKLLLLAAAVILTAANITDYAAARKERYESIRMQLPVSIRKFNHKWIKRITETGNMKLMVPISFALGIFISLGEFLCTGQIYLATIVYMLRRSPVFDLGTALLFVAYVTALVAPLIILLFAVHKGGEVFGISEAVRGKMPLIKLINALVFVVFGVFMLLV